MSTVDASSEVIKQYVNFHHPENMTEKAYYSIARKSYKTSKKENAQFRTNLQEKVTRANAEEPRIWKV